MKKWMYAALILLLAAVLIFGGITHNRPRPLMDCLPAQPWEKFYVLLDRDVPSEALDDIRSLLSEITVKPRGKFSRFPAGFAAIDIYTGETTIILEIGADGNICIGDIRDLEKSRAYWHTDAREICTQLVQKYGDPIP